MSDSARLLAQRTEPEALMLWRALQPLRSTVRFMNTGAHPDDETSGMLAALTYRDGLSISYACSTRGEGGQNDIGREAGAVLGTLRTAEMARACDVLGMTMHWLSQSPEDTITDFGFSKSGVETLAKWGHTRTLRRFAEIIRADRPDIICPTFLDIPGQHGHHRAMTQAAQEVIAAAADPNFKAAGKPWQVSKLYLPGWSGAGTAYDDDQPPPPQTVRIAGHGREPLSGWTWAEIGQHSRVFHATQGMGRWVGAAEGAGWPLHLAISAVGDDAGAITDNLPGSFAAIAPRVRACAELDAALAETVAAFPDRAGILAGAGRALVALRAARAACPPDLADALQHRLCLKETQLARVIRFAAGIRAEARLESDHARPGGKVGARLSLHAPQGPVTARLNWAIPDGWQASDDALHLPPYAQAADPYPVLHQPDGPCGPVNMALTMTLAGQDVTAHLPLESPLLVLPATLAEITPQAIFVNARDPRATPLRLSDGAAINLPDGWTCETADGGMTLIPPPLPAPELFHLAVTVAGNPAEVATHVSYPHTGPLLHHAPAVLRLRVADVALAAARIGYIGGGNDRADHWMQAMGADVTILDPSALKPGILAGLDTLVIGIFAMKTVPKLAGFMQVVKEWVAGGGTLLTLYHRPWDNWNPDTIPPARLEVGQPSLRWRVTDETATVTHLAPDHPVLTGPNPISHDDWGGWVKERGLYFAKSWDTAYTPLLEMADPEEAPHRGALLSAEIGAGRHTHCALIVHLQMEALVPGAFRLMANMIAPRRRA
ncbi:PIG-L family deacetylase [Roseinatronobacter sp.]